MKRPQLDFAFYAVPTLLAVTVAVAGISGCASTIGRSAPASKPGPVTTSTNLTPPRSSSTSAGMSACAASQLAISEGDLLAGLGHSGVAIRFRNTSSRPCAITGYPQVAGVEPNGQSTRARHTPSGYAGGLSHIGEAPPVVTLAPGESVSSEVEGSDVPGGPSCPALSGLLVTAPGTDLSVRLAVAPGDCSGLEVHPVVPGATGRESS